MRRGSTSTSTGSGGSDQLQLAGVPLAERGRGLGGAAYEHPQVDLLHLEHRRARVEPADLEQVGQQRLEAVELVLQQLGRAGGRRVEVVTGLVQHVRRHPYRRQRGAQLMADVGDEPLLHPREVLQPADLLLQAGRHLVEGGAQTGQVVVALDMHALGQVPGRQPLGDARRQPDGRHDLTRHDVRDEPDHQHEQGADAEHGAAHQVEGLLLAGEREQVVELVLPDAGHAQPGPRPRAPARHARPGSRSRGRSRTGSARTAPRCAARRGRWTPTPGTYRARGRRRAWAGWPAAGCRTARASRRAGRAPP